MSKRTLLLLPILAFSASPARAAFTLLDKDQWKITMGGFVETDVISDSVRSFTETIGNTPVDRTGAASLYGRTQFSIRNTRLDFGVEAPEFNGWKSRGYMEFDLLGYDPAPSSTGSGVTEAGFFNNPTLRVRHAFVNVEKDGWQLMAGQYWALFGWQPYFFIPSIEVAPLPGMLYSRTAQLRATKSVEVSDSQTVQAAIGVMRPPQRDAEYPGLELGARWVLNSRSAGFTGGATGAMKPQPMSVGVTGAFRELQALQNPSVPTSAGTDYPGSAFAVDALVPIVASADGKDVSNNLVLGGEFTDGTGYGDEFNSWTGNLPNPTTAAGAAPYANMNLDGGIGGFNSANAFSLVHLQTWNGYLQYHLSQECRTGFAVGGSQLFSNNVTNFVPAAGKVVYNREQSAFANVMHDFSDQIRVGAEYAFIRTTYADGEEFSDNRYQVSFWFIF